MCRQSTHAAVAPTYIILQTHPYFPPLRFAPLSKPRKPWNNHEINRKCLTMHEISPERLRNDSKHAFRSLLAWFNRSARVLRSPKRFDRSAEALGIAEIDQNDHFPAILIFSKNTARNVKTYFLNVFTVVKRSARCLVRPSFTTFGIEENFELNIIIQFKNK